MRLAAGKAIIRVPKELTRITSNLLASGWYEVIAMLKSKTHYEQVPLETVRKIIEEQNSPEITAAGNPIAEKKEIGKELSETREQSKPSSVDLLRWSYPSGD